MTAPLAKPPAWMVADLRRRTGPPDAGVPPHAGGDEGMTMEATTARTQVVNYLATIPSRGKDRWVIVDDQTIDHELFWMFFWTTSRAFWPRRRTIPMAGNYPVAVTKG